VKAGYKDMAMWMHTVAGSTLEKLEKKWAKILAEEAREEAKSAASSSRASGK